MVEEQKYNQDAFESTHDFAKEAVDAIERLKSERNSAPQ